MQGKWDEMFGEKKEEVVEEVKVKKPRKKAVVKRAACSGPKNLDSFLGFLRGYLVPSERAAKQLQTQRVSDTPGQNGYVWSCTHLP